MAWLASCLDLAVRRDVEDGRLFARWLHETGQDWPDHDLLVPTAVAMIPSGIAGKSFQSLQSGRVFGCDM